MINYIKQLLRENLITEKLTDVDLDVDMLYDSLFKSDIDLILSTNKINDTMFKKKLIDTSILTTEDCIKTNDINPCSIKVNGGTNYYKPDASEISISINIDAVNFVILDCRGDLNEAVKHYSNIMKEFTEEKIKGSIHHELAHWIDDSLNNRHILKTLNRSNNILSNKKASEYQINKVLDFKKNINASKLEIQGQIHNIKQLYNKYKNEWDTLSFEDMVSLSPSLNNISGNLNGDIKNKWIKNLKTRMYREGLLGKNMFK